MSTGDVSDIDKPLYTELVYGTVKRKMTLDFYLRPFVKTKIKSWVRQLLWMSLYQYIYLDKVPNHAIINEAVNIAKHRGGPHNGNVVNAILRTIFRSELPSLESIKNDKQRMAVEYSIQSGLLNIGLRTMVLKRHERWHHHFDQTAGTVRVNTSKNKVEDVVSSLQSEGYEVEVDELIPYCLHLKGHQLLNLQTLRIVIFLFKIKAQCL